MFKKITAFMVLSIVAFESYGLADVSAPTKIQIPFANSAGGAYVRTVPIASQIGIQNGAASYTDGFPPLNFTPVNAGGVPPFGSDMNGILRDVSAHARWWAAGGPVYYDGTYQTAIGGYPKGAIVQSATVTGKLWFSSTENNVTNPDIGGAGWSPVMSTVYAPLTGTGASGTWGINITGNAATANIATSAVNATNATNATFATSAGNAATVTTNANLTGVIVSLGNLTGLPKSATAGTAYLIGGPSTAITNATATPVEVYNFLIQQGGTYRTYFEIYAPSGSGQAAQGRIYKNGVAYGTQRSTTAMTPTAFTEDLVFDTGDTVQFFMWTGSVSLSAAGQNMRLGFTKGSISIAPVDLLVGAR